MKNFDDETEYEISLYIEPRTGQAPPAIRPAELGPPPNEGTKNGSRLIFKVSERTI